MAISQREFRDQTLRAKFGFQPVPGSGHEAVALIVNGRKVATTRFSRKKGRDLSDDLLGRIAAEIFAPTLGFLKGMHNCTKSMEDYIEALVASGKLPRQTG